MARFLGKRGAEVTEAGDGAAALERIRGGFEPQVILADLRMPRMDGAEFYERLLEEQPRLAERVLFLSGDITHLAGRGLSDVPRDRVLVKLSDDLVFHRDALDALRRSVAVYKATSPKIDVARYEAEIVAMWAGGAFAPTSRFNLSATPCESVLDGEIAAFPRRVAQMFPAAREVRRASAMCRCSLRARPSGWSSPRWRCGSRERHPRRARAENDSRSPVGPQHGRPSIRTTFRST